jgi:hypothetical protein
MTSARSDAGARSLSDFDGDFDQLGQLMHHSWSENQAQALLYSPRFLQSFLQQPGATSYLAPTIYHGPTPVGFVAGFPRRVRYRDREWNIVVITLLTIAPEQKKMGYGIVLWSELVKRAQALGFDGMMNYCIDGEPMNGMITGCCQRMKLPVEHVFSVNYLTSVLWPKGPDQQPELPFEDTEAFLTAAASASSSAEIARRWTPEEVRWQCSREGAVVATHQAGSHFGLMTGSIMELTDENRTRTLLVDDILWGSLEGEERTALARKFTTMAAVRGARIASVPILGYADMEPFRAARFRASARRLHAYFTLWKDSPILGPVESLYLDVF